jgi:uncharacterized protein YaaW (UPF0174 family)
MSAVTREDITKLIKAASVDELKELSEILEMDGTSEVDSVIVELWWKYQTPIGFFARDPSFDEICRNIAKILKLDGLAREKDSCWDLLRKIVGNLIDRMLEDLPADKREEALKELLDEKDIENLKKNYGGDVAKLVGGGAAIWIGTLSFHALKNLLLRVIHGIIRAILGRGLSYAAAKKVLGVVAKRVPILGIVAGPVGWILTIWGINDLMGTNYKRVIPAVLFIYCVYITLKADGKCPID